jgi:hypothetical protein
METRLPTYQEMQALVAFLPRLYSAGFQPVIKWNGGDQGKDSSFTLPWPDYDPVVEEFYRLAASDCWLDHGYHPEEAAKLLKEGDFVKSASISQIKVMLTFCVRGERFSDGHWAEMIENGSIRRILERINELSTDALYRAGSGETDGTDAVS